MVNRRTSKFWLKLAVKRSKYAVVCVSAVKNNRSHISNRVCVTLPQYLTINRSNLYLDWWENTTAKMMSLILRNTVKITFIRVEEEQLFKPLLISPLPKSKSPPLTLPPIRVFFQTQIKPNHTGLRPPEETRGLEAQASQCSHVPSDELGVCL